MKAFVITLQGNEYSEQMAKRCIDSAAKFGVIVEKFYGVDKTQAKSVMEREGLKWTWANNNTSPSVCTFTRLQQTPYKDAKGQLANIDAKIGCSMSHYLLWKKCIELNEPILILEHDAIFICPLPEIEFDGICQINDPLGATYKGNWWHAEMVKRGTGGVHEKMWVRPEKERNIPDGLAGNSAYMIKPWAAQELVNKVKEIGVWPNDATICKQLFPYLEEYYPFVTKVHQVRSTSS